MSGVGGRGGIVNGFKEFTVGADAAMGGRGGLRSHVKVVFFLRIRQHPRSTQSRSSAASDVYKRQPINNDFANKIGADGYGKDAVEAVKVSKKLVGV